MPPETDPKPKIEPKIETPKSFPDADAKFSNWENAKKFSSALGLYERAKINIVDKTKIMFNDKLFDWHHGGAVELKSRFEKRSESLRKIEEQKNEHSNMLEKLEKDLGRPLDAKTIRKAEKEKEDMQKRVDREKIKIDKLQSKIESRNQKKEAYENRRKAICENVIGKIDTKLEPYESKLGILKNKKEQLALEIGNFKKTKEDLVSATKKLEQEANNSIFKSERRICKLRIKEIRKELKRSDKIIQEKRKSASIIDKNITKFDKGAAPWRDKRDQIARTTRLHERKIDTSVDVRKREKADFSQKQHIEPANRLPEDAPDVKKEVKKPKPVVAEPEPSKGAEKREKSEFEKELEELEKAKEVKEKEPEFSVGDLSNIWNSRFASDLPVTEEALKKVVSAKEAQKRAVPAGSYDFKAQTDLTEFSDNLRTYYFVAKKENAIKKISDSDFEEYLAIFRDIIKTKGVS